MKIEEEEDPDLYDQYVSVWDIKNEEDYFDKDGIIIKPVPRDENDRMII